MSKMVDCVARAIESARSAGMLRLEVGQEVEVGGREAKIIKIPNSDAPSGTHPLCEVQFQNGELKTVLAIFVLDKAAECIS